MLKFVLIVIAILIVLLVLIKIHSDLKVEIHRLPLENFGYENIPAIPFRVEKTANTLFLLSGRTIATFQAQNGLSNTYTIDSITTTGYEFMLGKKNYYIKKEDVDKFNRKLSVTGVKMIGSKDRALTVLVSKSLDIQSTIPNMIEKKGVIYQQLSLDSPDQFAMAWTNSFNRYEKNLPLLEKFSDSLVNVKVANEAFWPTIADSAAVFNSQVLEKVSTSKLAELQKKYENTWNVNMDSTCREGRLFAIDMRIFSNFESKVVQGVTRFTPSTLTLLELDSETNKLTPIAVWVSGYKDKNLQYYEYSACTDGAWLYALQAAKTSITCWGIWIGHVYGWHIQSAAIQMTMYDNIPKGHEIYKLLAPSSEYVIEFDDVLLLLWKSVAPPSSFATPRDFLDLIEEYSKDQSYFDGDPYEYIERAGLMKCDFSVNEDWDQFQGLKQELQIWDAVETYMQVFVENTYPSDDLIKSDNDLQSWIKDTSSKQGGNLKGFSKVDTQAKLVKVLTSYLYKITIHGNSRISSSHLSQIAFVGNNPPCLQQDFIPASDKKISTKELLKFMPNTGTIGEFWTFISVFVFSAPYVCFIPMGGAEADLYFNNGDKSDPKNIALIELREFLRGFIKENFADDQVQQWPRSIET